MHEFKVVNDSLPHEYRLSIEQRRRIISDSIYPSFKNVPKSKIRVRDMRAKINQIVSQIPPDTTANPLTIEDIDLAIGVEFYNLETHIQTVIPPRVYVRVYHPDMGDTGIFLRQNLSFHLGKLHEIVEACRNLVDNSSGNVMFYGSKLVIPGRPDDGRGDNYYILFQPDVRHLEDTGISTEWVEGETPRAKPSDGLLDADASVRKQINELKKVKRKRSRVAKEMENTLKRIKKIKDSTSREDSEASKALSINYVYGISNTMIEKLMRAYESGTISAKKMNAEIKKLLKARTIKLKKGGRP